MGYADLEQLTAIIPNVEADLLELSDNAVADCINNLTNDLFVVSEGEKEYDACEYQVSIDYLSSVTSVSVDGVELTAAQYTLYPVGKNKWGCWSRIITEIKGDVLAIGGSWGASTIPDYIQSIATIATRILYQQTFRVATAERTGSYSVNYADSEFKPVYEMLKNHLRQYMRA